MVVQQLSGAVGDQQPATGHDPGELLGDVHVSSDGNSFIIQLTVENTDPNLANDIARTWGMS